MAKGGRRHRRHRRRGGSFWGKLKNFGKKAFGWAKDHKIASKVARELGGDNIAKGLETMGFGRRRRHRRRGGGKLQFNGGGSNQQALLNSYLKTKVARMQKRLYFLKTINNINNANNYHN